MITHRLSIGIVSTFLALSLSGCGLFPQPSPAPTPPPTPQKSEGNQQVQLEILEPTMQTVTPSPADTQATSEQPAPADGKLIACNTDADCVPDPSTCHARTCVTKAAAASMPSVEACTMMYDWQAAYSPEDCACDLGKCVNKNLGRTGDAPVEVQ